MTTIIEQTRAQVERAEERVEVLGQEITRLRAMIIELRELPEPSAAEAGELVAQERRAKILSQTLQRARSEVEIARQEFENLSGQRLQLENILIGFEAKISALRPRVQEGEDLETGLYEMVEALVGTRFASLRNPINDVREVIRQEKLELCILEGKAAGVREKLTWYDAEFIGANERLRDARDAEENRGRGR